MGTLPGEHGVASRNEVYKTATSLFCVERLNRIVICIPVQSFTTAAGASSPDSCPITQNLKVTAGHPGSRAEASRFFRGRRRGIAHGSVGADSHYKCIRFINVLQS